jgi:hypothetical protein
MATKMVFKMSGQFNIVLSESKIAELRQKAIDEIVFTCEQYAREVADAGEPMTLTWTLEFV